MSDAFNALGPGDPDPRSPAAAGEAETPAPLGPGDDDPRSPVIGTPIASTAPLGPGESDADDDTDLVMLAPAAAGPGDTASGPRHVTHVPRRKPTIVTAVAVSESPAAPAEADDTSSAAHEEIT